MTEFCNQRTIMEFLSDSGVWVMSDGIWVRIMSYEYRVMKIESCLNQTGPSLQSKRIVLAISQELFIYSSFFFFFFFRIVYLFLNPNYQNKYILFFFWNKGIKNSRLKRSLNTCFIQLFYGQFFFKELKEFPPNSLFMYETIHVF